MTVDVDVSVLQEMQRYFDALPEVAEKAAAMALNDVSGRYAMARLQGQMEAEVNFPNGYLKSRMSVSKKASRGSLEAIISGRDRPTSLARFAAAGLTPKMTRVGGIRVQVKRGQTVHMRRAFLVRLRNNNIGLAVRLREGDQLAKSSAAVELGNNVYLLYGPSVDQVMQGVSNDQAPDIANEITNQFLRQFSRLNNVR